MEGLLGFLIQIDDKNACSILGQSIICSKGMESLNTLVCCYWRYVISSHSHVGFGILRLLGTYYALRILFPFSSLHIVEREPLLGLYHLPAKDTCHLVRGASLVPEARRLGLAGGKKIEFSNPQAPGEQNNWVPLTLALLMGRITKPVLSCSASCLHIYST